MKSFKQFLEQRNSELHHELLNEFNFKDMFNLPKHIDNLNAKFLPKKQVVIKDPTISQPTTTPSPEVTDDDIIANLKSTPFLNVPDDSTPKNTTSASYVPSFQDMNYYWMQYYGKGRPFTAIGTWDKMDDKLKIQNYQNLKQKVESGKKSMYYKPVQNNPVATENFSFKEWLEATDSNYKKLVLDKNYVRHCVEKPNYFKQEIINAQNKLKDTSDPSTIKSLESYIEQMKKNIEQSNALCNQSKNLK